MDRNYRNTVQRVNVQRVEDEIIFKQIDINKDEALRVCHIGNNFLMGKYFWSVIGGESGLASYINKYSDDYEKHLILFYPVMEKGKVALNSGPVDLDSYRYAYCAFKKIVPFPKNLITKLKLSYVDLKDDQLIGLVNSNCLLNITELNISENYDITIESLRVLLTSKTNNKIKSLRMNNLIKVGKELIEIVTDPEFNGLKNLIEFDIAGIFFSNATQLLGSRLFSQLKVLQISFFRTGEDVDRDYFFGSEELDILKQKIDFFGALLDTPKNSFRLNFLHIHEAIDKTFLKKRTYVIKNTFEGQIIELLNNDFLLTEDLVRLDLGNNITNIRYRLLSAKNLESLKFFSFEKNEIDYSSAFRLRSPISRRIKKFKFTSWCFKEQEIEQAIEQKIEQQEIEQEVVDEFQNLQVQIPNRY